MGKKIRCIAQIIKIRIYRVKKYILMILMRK